MKTSEPITYYVQIGCSISAPYLYEKSWAPSDLLKKNYHELVEITELTAYKDIARKLAEDLRWFYKYIGRGPEAHHALKEYEQLSQDNSGEKE